MSEDVKGFLGLMLILCLMPFQECTANVPELQEFQKTEYEILLDKGWDYIYAGVMADLQPSIDLAKRNALERNERNRVASEYHWAQVRHELEKQKEAEAEEKRIAEEEALRLAEEAAAAMYYAESYYDPVPYSYYEAPVVSEGTDVDLRSAGVVYDENGTRFTWYSQNVLPGGGLTELNSNGRTVDSNGFVVDADGYIAVATQGEKGSIVSTPYGEGKVYDYCETPGTVDIYTAW